jgi:hypothetical protein
MSVSRRHFAILAAVAAAVPTAVGQAAVPPPLNPEVEARIAMITGRFGSRLTDAQKADIRRLITGAQEGVEALRAYPLENSVEPATVFRVSRKASKPRKVAVH